MYAKLLHSCPTLCDPMDCSPPGSSVCEIFQARILEWGAISSSCRGGQYLTIPYSDANLIVIKPILLINYLLKIEFSCSSQIHILKPNAVEYYSDLKRNAVGSFLKTSVDLESAIQGEIHQSEREKSIIY